MVYAKRPFAGPEVVLTNAGRRENLARVRALLGVPPPEAVSDEIAVTPAPTFVRCCCGATMRVVEIP